MHLFHKTLIVASAAVLAAGSSYGQTTNVDTTTSFDGTIRGFVANTALVQTFDFNLNGASMYSVTYRFVTSAATSPTGLTLNAYFSEWNPNAPANAVGSALFSGVVNVTAPLTWTSFDSDTNQTPYKYYDVTVPLNLSLGAGTYAMSLVSTSGSSIALQEVDDAAFGAGTAQRRAGVTGGTYANLATPGATVTGGNDWGFKNISYSLTPVPEPSKAAAGLVAGFLGLMMVRRRLQSSKNQEVAA